MITFKTNKEIKLMRESGRILANVLSQVAKKVKPGITTLELDRLAESLILHAGATPGFKDYEGFPATMCISVNEEIVHGIPSKKVLRNGDIVSLDLGVIYHGFNSDMAVTVPVGDISERAQLLIDVTKEALKMGIAQAQKGKKFGDVSHAIGKYIESEGFSVVKNLCGHGIGADLHEDPQILNYGDKDTGEEIKEGMCFCIEPMLSIGSDQIKKMKDGYGYQTDDGSLSAHFEQTLAVTDKGTEILTPFL